MKINSTKQLLQLLTSKGFTVAKIANETGIHKNNFYIILDRGLEVQTPRFINIVQVMGLKMYIKADKRYKIEGYKDMTLLVRQWIEDNEHLRKHMGKGMVRDINNGKCPTMRIFHKMFDFMGYDLIVEGL